MRVKRSKVRGMHMKDICGGNDMAKKVIRDKSTELSFIHSEIRSSVSKHDVRIDEKQEGLLILNHKNNQASRCKISNEVQHFWLYGHKLDRSARHLQTDGDATPTGFQFLYYNWVLRELCWGTKVIGGKYWGVIFSPVLWSLIARRLPRYEKKYDTYYTFTSTALKLRLQTKYSKIDYRRHMCDNTEVCYFCRDILSGV